MPRTPLFLSDLCCCERLALWSVRCLINRYRLPFCAETRTTDGMYPMSFRSVLDAAERSFSYAEAYLKENGQIKLNVNPPGAQNLTEVEERFIQVIQIVQNQGYQEAFAVLDGIYPDHTLQGYLVAALALVADCMSGIGHWLPLPERKSTGAGALSSLVRWRDTRPEDVRVLWPRESSLKADAQVMH
ncbi:hypothetical protein [Swingsia samuiensis]|nr:hypothetical protein [Swingsia samuiensis]